MHFKKYEEKKQEKNAIISNCFLSYFEFFLKKYV